MSATKSRRERLSTALGVAILAIECGAGITTTAWAQDGVIVGGSLTVLGNPGSAVPVWTVVGNGISVVAGGADTGSSGGSGCDPCRPGRTVAMGGFYGGTTLGSGSAVVNGVLSRGVFFAGALVFQAKDAVIPDFDGNSWRNVTVPFHMAPGSQLQGYADSARTQLLFTIRPIIGTGTATLHLSQDGTFYSFESVTYTFGPGINLLQKPGFEEYTTPALGLPGWVSDTPFRETDAFSDTSQPYSGANNGACSTTAALDCGIYQEVTAPSTGTYMLTFYATADRDGGLVGANVNGALAVSSPVEARGFRNYGAPYTMMFQATAGDTIRVWMYSPAMPGFVVIDDVSLVVSQ
jgi:hypothetical protein